MSLGLPERIIHLGDRVLIHGYEETYKSFVVLSMAHAIATGTPWLGEFVTGQPRNVGIIQTEMRNPGLGERLKKIYGDSAPPDRIKFFSRKMLDELRRTSPMENQFSLIRKWVRKEKLEVVLVDVISDLFCCGKNPDKERDVSFVFDQLELIPEVKVWVMIRHDSKPKENPDGNSNNRIRGSSEWKENPDTILHLTKDGRSDTVKVSVGKLRYGRKPNPFSIRYDQKAATIVPGNPVLWLLLKGPLSREQLIEECRVRYAAGESRVDKWLGEVKSELSESHDGHKKIFTRTAPPSADLLWKFQKSDEQTG